MCLKGKMQGRAVRVRRTGGSVSGMSGMIMPCMHILSWVLKMPAPDHANDALTQLCVCVCSWACTRTQIRGHARGMDQQLLQVRAR